MELMSECTRIEFRGFGIHTLVLYCNCGFVPVFLTLWFYSCDFKIKHHFAPIPSPLLNGVNFCTEGKICPCDFAPSLLGIFVILPLFWNIHLYWNMTKDFTRVSSPLVCSPSSRVIVVAKENREAPPADVLVEVIQHSRRSVGGGESLWTLNMLVKDLMPKVLTKAMLV
jgi:hypothetical protein